MDRAGRKHRRWAGRGLFSIDSICPGMKADKPLSWIDKAFGLSLPYIFRAILLPNGSDSSV